MRIIAAALLSLHHSSR